MEQNDGNGTLSLITTIEGLRDIFLSAADKVTGPAHPLFMEMTKTALTGLAVAEQQLLLGQENLGVEIMRGIVDTALKKEDKIMNAAGFDPTVQGIFNDMAGDIIVKAVDVLYYGMDVLLHSGGMMPEPPERLSPVKHGSPVYQ